MTEYMLDTNAFNRALDSNDDPRSLSRRGGLYVTHIQLNEIQATRNPERLAALLTIVKMIDPEHVATSAALWDVSEWDASESGGDDRLYEQMYAALTERNQDKRGNNAKDVLIALTALKRGYTLVTNDADLTDVLGQFGGEAMRYDAFSTM